MAEARSKSAPEVDPHKLKVFISYSRSDAPFADELAAGLEFAREFEISMDRHSIVEGEDWKKRLGALIADADTVVFLLSPDSAISATCRWEVDEAWRLSKRILPVLVRPIGGIAAPERLAALNYVRFDEGRSFMAGLSGLVKALNTDVDWLREHTRLLARAMEWQAASREANRMLSGSDIDAAKAWLSRRPKDAPDVTELHLSFIRASEEAEIERASTERRRLEEMATAQAASAHALAEREAALKSLSRRTTIGILSAGGLTAAAAGLAWWGNDAERRFQRERQRGLEAEARAIEEAINKEANRADIIGQLTAYAAAPDQTALDGPADGNSPYTQALMEELADQRSSFQAALARATRKVMAYAGSQTGFADHQQRPFVSTDMNGEIYLFRKPKTRRLKALTISSDRVAGIGKDYYLANVERDARAWEALLKRAGFETLRLRNPSPAECEAAFENLMFEREVKRGGFHNPLIQRVGLGPIEKQPEPPVDTLVFIFYSGTGFVVEGDHFMGMIDTQIASPKDVYATAVNLTRLQTNLRQRAAASILVMDTNFNRIRERDISTGANR